MTVTEYIENLQRIKQLAVDNWGQLTEVERQIFDSSFDWLIDNLEIKKGDIVVDEDLSKSMDQFLSAVVKIVNNNEGYLSKLTSFLGDLKTIQKNNKDFHATAFNFNIETAGVKEVQKTVVNEIINQYLDNGLNQHFAAPLRDNVFRNILAGANMKQVREVLRNYILSGQDQSGKLGRYLHNTAIMAVDSYAGKINQQLMVEFDFTGLIISGSLIETSSKQCIYAVENSDRGYFTMKDWEIVLEMARGNKKALLIEGTTVKNLPLNKLHWGCRHDFTPVIKKAIEKDLPKVEKKEEPKSLYVEAKEISEAKEVSKRIMENAGLNITGVGVQNISLERFNLYNKKLDELTKEYNIGSGFTFKAPIRLRFISVENGNYGYVDPIEKGNLSEINFGDLTSGHFRIPKIRQSMFFLSHSRIDESNVEFSTLVHEFGHVITIKEQMLNNSNVQNFWSDIALLRATYSRELNKIPSTEVDKLSAMYLGQYANSNSNEFVAEGFTEYKLRKNPSKYAKKIGLLIDKYFKK